MANTGNIIVTERDTNPFSSTYDTTRTRTYQDWVHCIPDGYKWSYVRENNQSGYFECDANDTTILAQDTNFAYDSRTQYHTFRSVAIGNCVTEIGERAFSNMFYYNAGIIYIPSNVTTIGRSAFAYCDERAAYSPLTVETSAYDIGEYAFQYSGITTLILNNGVNNIHEGAFRNCTALSSINIPNSVEIIGQWAFLECTGATSVTIGTGVTNINQGAFQGCQNLQSITILATTPPSLRTNGAAPFYPTFPDNNCPIYVPAASVSTYQSAQYWSNYASRIQAIPS